MKFLFIQGTNNNVYIIVDKVDRDSFSDFGIWMRAIKFTMASILENGGADFHHGCFDNSICRKNLLRQQRLG